MSPDGPALDARLKKASALRRVGRLHEALGECEAALKLAPDHVQALLLRALLLLQTGHDADAAEAYERFLELEPLHLDANFGLAALHHKAHRNAEALPLLRTVLETAPDHAQARALMAAVLSDLRDVKGAWEHARKVPARTTLVLPYDGPPGAAIEVLVLCGWQQVNTPLDHALDRRFFRQTKLNADFHDPAKPLPFHHVAWNAVGDVELGAESLSVCERLLKRTRRPVLNPPAKIRPTGRADNARRLAGIPGLIVPKIVNFGRRDLESGDAAGRLRAAGFGFPLLIRAPGFQGGLNFEKVDAPGDLAGVLRSLPGEELVVLEYVDTRGPDGKVRKYRTMMVDGRLHPLHAAVSADWKVHYFSAGMRDNPGHRAEDRAFLEDMERALGAKAMAALRGVQKTLGLDYGGVDFSLSRDGEVIFFESNATMVVPRPPGDAVWDYRRAPVQRILDAVTDMLRARAGRAAPPAPRPLPLPASAVRTDGRGQGPPPPGPSALDLRLARAAGMHQSGLLKEAKLEYAAVLKENPDHVDALMKYGALMLETGIFAAAAQVYARAAALAPKNAAAHADLGLALAALGRKAEARARFEAALALNPELSSAHQGLAGLAVAAGDLAAARGHGRRAYAGKSHYELPHRGTGNAPGVLALCSALGGNLPLDRFVDRRGFRQTVLIVEYHDPNEPLPPHDVLFNAVGGPDGAPEALGLAAVLAKKSRARILNAPEKVARCGRAEIARLLAGIPGLSAPLDAHGADGAPPAYRALSVAQRLYPLQVPAPNPEASARGDAAGRAEEAASLLDLPSALGPRAARALADAQAALDLDYVGLDFSVDASGTVLLHGVDPAMALPVPPPGQAWTAPVHAAIEAVNDLLRSCLDVRH